MEPRTRSQWEDNVVGLGLVLGAGIGATVGLILAGAIGIALGGAVGGGLGIVLGAMGRSVLTANKEGTPTEKHS